MILRKPWLIFCFLTSFFCILLAIILSFTGTHPFPGIWKALLIVTIAQIGSSIFYPMVVGYFYERMKYNEGVETVWNVFRDLSDGGIIRFYMDREESGRPQNALLDLRNSFNTHRKGEIKLIGVSLRVFFNQAGPFYKSIYKLCDLAKDVESIKIRALISHPDSPEVFNRTKIETPDQLENPLIKIEINSTIVSIENLNKDFKNTPIDYGYYKEAPYCTCIIFTDKCFFSPNILAKDPPVRLPMIVFQKNSNGYKKLEQYFDHIWKTKIMTEKV